MKEGRYAREKANKGTILVQIGEFVAFFQAKKEKSVKKKE